MFALPFPIILRNLIPGRLSFVGYVPLASQNLYPIIIYSVANYIYIVSLKWQGAGGLLGLSFVGYMPLASQNPYPIIVNPVVKMPSHPAAQPH